MCLLFLISHFSRILTPSVSRILATLKRFFCNICLIFCFRFIHNLASIESSLFHSFIPLITICSNLHSFRFVFNVLFLRKNCARVTVHSTDTRIPINTTHYTFIQPFKRSLAGSHNFQVFRFSLSSLFFHFSLFLGLFSVQIRHSFCFVFQA